MFIWVKRAIHSMPSARFIYNHQSIIKQQSRLMSNSHLNLETEFFQNNGNQQPPSPPQNPQRPFKMHQNTTSNHLTPHSTNEGEPSDSPHQNKFYQQYKRILSVSHNLGLQKLRLMQILGSLQSRIQTLHQKLTMQPVSKPKDPKTSVSAKREATSEESRNKRARRTAEQIEKKFKCEVAFCQRFYGSEGSLQQHIKLKHPQLATRESEDEYLPFSNKEAQEHSST